MQKNVGRKISFVLVTSLVLSYKFFVASFFCFWVARTCIRKHRTHGNILPNGFQIMEQCNHLLDFWNTRILCTINLLSRVPNTSHTRSRAHWKHILHIQPNNSEKNYYGSRHITIVLHAKSGWSDHVCNNNFCIHCCCSHHV